MKRICSVIIFSFMLFLQMPVGALAAELLIPGGQVIGLQLEDGSVTVAAFDDALGDRARQAGLRVGDIIESINGQEVSCVQDIRGILEPGPETVALTIRRGSKKHALQFVPYPTGSGSRLGVFLKQGISGIGTVTWIDPDSGIFGALGHGVNDGRGVLLAMTRGTAFPAEVISVRKGAVGEPGQLKGNVGTPENWGNLFRNTPQGVFGTTLYGTSAEALPVAEYEDIVTGAATIRSTVSGNTVQEYSVEILKIYPEDRPCGRNFLLKVTDPRLLNTTGGIVQGMSGSPILQNGTLVGAVTHVLVNDPTMGYGIFIENMTDAAE